jgi:surfactin synthase thioesterase subunit
MAAVKGSLNPDAPLVVCGDSLGCVMAWQFIHNLYEETGIRPSHVCVSGSPSPRIASHQLGLGRLAKRSIREETKEDLAAFLRKGGAEDSDEVIEALRADCILYEDFQRGNYAKLPVPGTLFRGSDDPLGGPADQMQQWSEEFESFKEVVLPGAGHAIYGERPVFMAEELVALVSQDKNN